MENSRMNDDAILEVFQSTRAIRRGHFKLTSGRHSDTYIQCARVLEHPSLTMKLAYEAVARLPKELEIDLVASPAVGGILFGFAVACALDKPLIFSERVDGKMVFRRSFEVPDGARVLIVEDVVTTGGSVNDVCDLVLENGGSPVGVVSLIDRGATSVFDLPYYPLLQLAVPSWEETECLMCKEGVLVDSPGSRLIHK